MVPGDKAQSMDMATRTLPVDFSLAPAFRESPDLRELLGGLLERDPEKRIKCLQVKDSAWFTCTDWGRLELSQVEPPFVPTQEINASAERDIGEFPDVKLDLTAEESRRMARGWSYARQFAYQLEVVKLLGHCDVHGPVKTMDEANDLCCAIS